MRRILAIVLLAAVIVLALSVPAVAKPSSPPDAFGEYNAWLVQKMIKDYGLPYGRYWNAPIRWAIWWGTVPYENGGEYVASVKEDASY